MKLLNFDLISVFPIVRGPGGALWGDYKKAPGGAGRLSVVSPRRPKGRAAAFGQDDWPYSVRHVRSGQGGGPLRTGGDG